MQEAEKHTGRVEHEFIEHSHLFPFHDQVYDQRSEKLNHTYNIFLLKVLAFKEIFKRCDPKVACEG